MRQAPIYFTDGQVSEKTGLPIEQVRAAAHMRHIGQAGGRFVWTPDEVNALIEELNGQEEDDETSDCTDPDCDCAGHDGEDCEDEDCGCVDHEETEEE